MKVLQYTKPNNLSKLHDELLAAIPSLAPVDVSGVKTPSMYIQSSGDRITMSVPDATDEAAVTTVVNAHDPSPFPDNDAILLQEAEQAIQPLRNALSNYDTLTPLQMTNLNKLMVRMMIRLTQLRVRKFVDTA